MDESPTWCPLTKPGCGESLVASHKTWVRQVLGPTAKIGEDISRKT